MPRDLHDENLDYTCYGQCRTAKAVLADAAIENMAACFSTKTP